MIVQCDYLLELYIISYDEAVIIILIIYYTIILIITRGCLVEDELVRAATCAFPAAFARLDHDETSRRRRSRLIVVAVALDESRGFAAGRRVRHRRAVGGCDGPASGVASRCGGRRGGGLAGRSVA